MRTKPLILASASASVTLTLILTLAACSSFEANDAPPPDTTAEGGPGVEGGGEGGPSSETGLTLTVTEATKPAYLVQGGDVELPFQLVRRPGSTGAVVVNVSAGLPDRVAAVPFTVPAGQNSGRVLLRSDADAVQGLVTLELSAVEQAPGNATAAAKKPVFVRGKPGALDTTFGDKGLVSSVWRAPFTGGLDDGAFDEQGSLLVIGTRSNGTSVHALGRLTSAGAADTTFQGGVITLGGSQVGTALAVHGPSFASKGTIDAMTGTPGTIELRRYSPTGAPVTTFASGSVVANLPGHSQATGQQLVPLADGKLLLLARYASPAVFAVSRWTASGGLDATYGSAGGCAVDGAGIAASSVTGNGRMLVKADGSVRIVFTLSNGETVIKACTAGGVVDAAVSKDLGAGRLVEVASTADGGMVVLSSTVDGTLQWRRFSAALALDSSIGTAGTVAAGLPFLERAGLVVQPDGRVLVGAAEDADFKVKRFLPTGAPDSTFAALGTLVVPVAGTNTAELSRLVRAPDGRVVAIGLQYNTADGAIARFWP